MIDFHRFSRLLLTIVNSINFYKFLKDIFLWEMSQMIGVSRILKASMLESLGVDCHIIFNDQFINKLFFQFLLLKL